MREAIRTRHYSHRTEEAYVGLDRVRAVHERDLKAGFGRVQLPDAVARKYPNADREWSWQWVFPASKICTDPRFSPPQRFHLHESVPQRAVHAAARKAGIAKPVGPHTLSHCVATPLLEAGDDIRTVQELLGHRDVKTPMISTHVLNRSGHGVQSPADRLLAGGSAVIARADKPRRNPGGEKPSGAQYWRCREIGVYEANIPEGCYAARTRGLCSFLSKSSEIQRVRPRRRAA